MAQILPQRDPTSWRAARPDSPWNSLKQRDKELEALRTRQRKVLERGEAQREIELMGDDRRKFNEQSSDTAARVSGVEERICEDAGAPRTA